MKTALRSALVVLLLALMGGVCVWHDTVAQSVKNGLMVCGYGVIPAVFPVTVIALLLGRAMRPLIHSKAGLWLLLLLSLLGGYTVGVLLLNELYGQKALTARQADRLLLCLSNPGIGLVLGPAVKDRPGFGTVLWLSMCLVDIVLFYAFTRTIPTVKPMRHEKPDLAKAVTGAFSVTGQICAFVLFFCVINGMLSVLFPFSFLGVLTGLMEVTGGLFCNESLYVCCFLAMSGGVCVALQLQQLSRFGTNWIAWLIKKCGIAAVITGVYISLIRVFRLSVPTALTRFHGTKSFQSGYAILLLFSLTVFLTALGEKKVEIWRNICYNEKRKRDKHENCF